MESCSQKSTKACHLSKIECCLTEKGLNLLFHFSESVPLELIVILGLNIIPRK